VWFTRRYCGGTPEARKACPPSLWWVYPPSLWRAVIGNKRLQIFEIDVLAFSVDI
jgi:hypothetical protein